MGNLRCYETHEYFDDLVVIAKVTPRCLVYRKQAKQIE